MIDTSVRELLENLIAQAMVRHATRGAPKLLELSVHDAERILAALSNAESVPAIGIPMSDDCPGCGAVFGSGDGCTSGLECPHYQRYRHARGEYPDLTDHDMAKLRLATVAENDPGRVRRIVSQLSFDGKVYHTGADGSVWRSDGSGRMPRQLSFDDHGGYDESVLGYADADPNAWINTASEQDQPDVSDADLATLMAANGAAIDRAEAFLDHNPIPLTYPKDIPEVLGRYTPKSVRARVASGGSAK